MSEHAPVPPHDEPYDATHGAVRDALPALLHGRVSASRRAELEAHLATCAACAAELRMLAVLRDAHVTASPTVAVDRIAAAVRARTVGVDGGPARAPVSRSAPSAVRHVPPRGPAWARRGALRAVAATALLAIGSGALVFRVVPGSTHAGAPIVARPAAAAGVAATAAARDPNASLLGANFSDLSEDELAAVVAAVDDPASASPAAEPAPVTPTVLAPEGE